MRPLILSLLIGASLQAQFVPAVFNGGATSTPAVTSKVCYAQGAGSASPVTCTWKVGSTGTGLAIGDHVVIYVDNGQSGATPSTFSLADNGATGGNTYTANGSVNHTNGQSGNTQLFYTVATKTATTSSVTIGGSGGVSFGVIFGVVYSGGTGAPDGAVGFSSTAGASTLTASSTPATSPTLALCFSQMFAGGVTVTPDAAYTAFSDADGPPTNISGASRQRATSGSTSATFGNSNSTTNADLTCAAWK
jgi:hypothetical protein